MQERDKAHISRLLPPAPSGYDSQNFHMESKIVKKKVSASSGPHCARSQPGSNIVNAETAAAPLEVLAFRLGAEEYALDILRVQEIRGYEAVTRIASAPEFIKGVTNLRGLIVPIVDMRIRFRLGAPTYDQFTVVIILNIGGRVVGMVVDSVSDVISLTPAQIKPAPDMGAALRTDHLLGLGTVDERMLILLDIDKLLTDAELGMLAGVPA
jgi:purine-binding chemotaxis protein CheW